MRRQCPGTWWGGRSSCSARAPGPAQGPGLRSAGGCCFPCTKLSKKEHDPSSLKKITVLSQIGQKWNVARTLVQHRNVFCNVAVVFVNNMGKHFVQAKCNIVSKYFTELEKTHIKYKPSDISTYFAGCCCYFFGQCCESGSAPFLRIRILVADPDPDPLYVFRYKPVQKNISTEHCQSYEI